MTLILMTIKVMVIWRVIYLSHYGKFALGENIRGSGAQN
jgi:hypothetical protein